jgi:multidrug efflux pump subunit AcrA (membrane-fusion protein)
MARKLLLPALAVLGVVVALMTVRAASRPIPSAAPVAQPAQPPFRLYVAGAGIVEASSENIAIGTVVPGVVTKVFVQYGQNVKAGDPLFQIDTRDLAADLAVKKAALLSAQVKLQRLQSMPRPEDVPIAQAQVDEEKATLVDVQTQFDLYVDLKNTDKAAVGEDDFNKRRYAVEETRARLAQAEANLAELKAGTWKPDLDVAQADVVAAQAQVDADQALLDRATVSAPIDGQLLQVKIHAGEFAPAGVLEQPLMLLGRVDKLVVRTDVDENDAWRVHPGAAAVGFLRGNRDIKVKLDFFRVEPYVVPKKSLTGETTERVDTRVLQVLFTFDRGDLPIYAGQQLDVYIDAAAAGNMPAS